MARDADFENEIRRNVVDLLDKFSLARFPDIERDTGRKYVMMFALHAGIPVHCLGDLLSFIHDHITHGRPATGAAVMEWLEEPGKEHRAAALDVRLSRQPAEMARQWPTPPASPTTPCLDIAVVPAPGHTARGNARLVNALHQHRLAQLWRRNAVVLGDGQRYCAARPSDLGRLRAVNPGGLSGSAPCRASRHCEKPPASAA